MSTQPKHSPWHIVTVGLLGLAAGYALVVVTHGTMAYAGGMQCPQKAAQQDAAL